MQLYLSDLLFAVSSALDCVEQELVGVTTNHSRRVALLSTLLCKHLGMDKNDVYDMGTCAILHDNALTEYTLHHGRAQVRRLTNVEMHCTSGERNAAHFPYRGDARNIILHHHENWDGSGYFGHKGKKISTRAAVLRLADNIDLLLALGTGDLALVEKGRDHVRELSGTVYNPEVSAAFLDIFDEGTVRDLAHENVGAAFRSHTSTHPREITLDELERICQIFGCITDAKSPHTATHSQGVAQKTRTLAEYLKLNPTHQQRLVIAAHLHDVGKLSIPPEILEKPGALSPEEFKVMQSHALMTEEILRDVRGLEEIAQWAASHHEKVNGGGYPHGIAGELLPMESRLLACVDVYQALVEDRPYRRGMGHEMAMAILRRMGSGGALDAFLVDELDKAMCPFAHTLPGAHKSASTEGSRRYV